MWKLKCAGFCTLVQTRMMVQVPISRIRQVKANSSDGWTQVSHRNARKDGLVSLMIIKEYLFHRFTERERKSLLYKKYLKSWSALRVVFVCLIVCIGTTVTVYVCLSFMKTFVVNSGLNKTQLFG